MTTSASVGKLPSYVMGGWMEGNGAGTLVCDATTGEPVTVIDVEGIDLAQALDFARSVGGPNLRRMTFHERAMMLRSLAKHLIDNKERLYELSSKSGTTRKDAWFDIDGGIGTFFSYSGLIRRELPNDTFLVEDEAIALSKAGGFWGRHLLVPREGVAVHINPFNFPCWAMLEKLAPTLAAGMPAVVKPAPQTAFVAEAMFRQMVATGLLPEGAVQLISGDAVDFFEHLVEQDVVSFTGSAATGRLLRAHPNVIDRAIPFTVEADSLNCAVLGASVAEGDPEFDLFVKEVVREMTVKAGQRCTAIRRACVPRSQVDAVLRALVHALEQVRLGDPRAEGVEMGPLVSVEQRDEVASRVAELRDCCEVAYGGRLPPESDAAGSAFHPLTLLYCDAPLKTSAPHDVEAFGPVATVMPYDTLNDANAIVKRGRGSLVTSVFTADAAEASALVLGSASHHGRMLVINRHNAKEQTGHGSPLPHLVHGGPGRAGGGEELGGVRAIKHYMQRTALQADPTTLMAVSGEYVPGARTSADEVHPFRKTFDDLPIGESYLTHRRTISEADIVHFAGVSGDFWYGHMDELAAKDSIFEKRVAHGYFLVSAAAGLFVDPRPGPVLANYGLDNLRFLEPVAIGDTVQVQLTVKRKIRKEKREPGERATGIVVWDVAISNQHGATVARYDVLTLMKRDDEA